MKFDASTPNPFSFTPPLTFGDELGRATVRRQPFRIKPFAMEDLLPSVADSDNLARKQEIICAIILGLCLLASVVISLTQLLPS